MSKGGNTCNRLKFIRKRLAEQNGIDYKVERCPNSDNCKEGTCPFCEKEVDELMTVLLEKEKRGEKVVWDVSLDEYDPSTLYGDEETDEDTIASIDTDSSTLEEIKLRPTMMGRLIDRKKMPDLKDMMVDGMVDVPPFINPDNDLQGFVPKPNKEFEFLDFKKVDAPWFDIDKENDFCNEKKDSSISSEKPLVAEVLPGTDFSTPFCKPLMGDIAIAANMGLASDVEIVSIDNPDVKLKGVDNSDLMVRTDPTDLDDDNFDDTLLALQYIHQLTGSKFTDTLNAYLCEGKDVETAIQYLTTFGGYEKRIVQNDKPEEKLEKPESRTIPDDFLESKVIPITVEAIRTVRQATSEGMMYCKRILQKCGGHIDKAVEEIKKHQTRMPLMGSVKRDDNTEEK